MAALILVSAMPALCSCGSTRAYWGVENEYVMDHDGHGHYKKPKHKKHKKHHKHHHHHDHDDDD